MGRRDAPARRASRRYCRSAGSLPVPRHAGRATRPVSKTWRTEPASSCAFPPTGIIGFCSRAAADSTACCCPRSGGVGGFPSALARGFAVVSTDSGHRGRSSIDARFGADQQAKLDFAYQAVARTTLQAKSLIARFYGNKPDYSYFMGCSTGGREAMLAAQRLPLEFDGVVAGNPSYNLTRIAINQVWSLQTVTRIAPKDASGKPDLSRAFTDAQLKAVSEAVLRQCDALDGLRDGMINDFQACRFDPKSHGLRLDRARRPPASA